MPASPSRSTAAQRGPARRGRWRSRLATAAVLSWLAAVPAWADLSGAAVWAPEGAAWGSGELAQPLLVGTIVNGRESATIDIYREGDQLLLPLRELAAVLGVSITTQPDGSVTLETPLGPARLAATDLREINDLQVVDRERLEAALAATIRFDEREFALLFELPWPTSAVSEGAAPAPTPTAALTPDIHAPSATLSTIQVDLAVTDQAGSRRSSGSTVLGGRIGGGWWRLRHRTDFAGDDELREYAWLRRTGEHSLLQLGHQLVRLHPLLPSVELTGAQVAWTNQDLDLYRRSAYPGELLPRNATPIRTFRGPAPPGGIAELRIDGVPVERQVVGLTGTYEFLDVPLDARQATIEVRVYDRANLLTPREIRTEELGVSSLLLQAGRFGLLAGVGGEGNLTESQPETAAGFAGYRRGLSDRVTLELAAQRNGHLNRGSVGVVTELARGLVTAAAASTTDEGAAGFDLELDGHCGEWWLTARSRWLEAGFDEATATNSWDHRGEIRRRIDDTLELGVTGRSAHLAAGDTRFLLPTVSWHPGRKLWLRGRATSEGDYQTDLRWTPRPRIEVTVSSLDRTLISTAYRASDSWRLALEGELGGGGPDIYSVFATWTGPLPWQPSVTTGPRVSDGEVGYRVRASAALAGGVYAVVQIDDAPVPVGTGYLDGGRRVFAALSSDLTFFGGHLIPARTGSVRDDRGAIAGRVALPPHTAVERSDLVDVAVLLNGYPGTTTREGGSFYIGDLPPGLYRVALDAEGLPIELVPAGGTIVVEVAAAAVTRVALPVRLEYGLAGRVVDAAGEPVPDVTVTATAADGAVAGRGTTDRFGLYRIDGLPPDTYHLRATGGTGAGTGDRSTTIVDDYLFGQDIVLSTPAAGIDPGGH